MVNDIVSVVEIFMTNSATVRSIVPVVWTVVVEAVHEVGHECIECTTRFVVVMARLCGSYSNKVFFSMQGQGTLDLKLTSVVKIPRRTLLPRRRWSRMYASDQPTKALLDPFTVYYLIIRGEGGAGEVLFLRGRSGGEWRKVGVFGLVCP